MDVALDFGRRAATPRDFQFIKALEVQPEFGIGVEVACQAQHGVRGDAAALVNDFTDTSNE